MSVISWLAECRKEPEPGNPAMPDHQNEARTKDAHNVYYVKYDINNALIASILFRSFLVFRESHCPAPSNFSLQTHRQKKPRMTIRSGVRFMTGQLFKLRMQLFIRLINGCSDHGFLT